MSSDNPDTARPEPNTHPERPQPTKSKRSLIVRRASVAVGAAALLAIGAAAGIGAFVRPTAEMSPAVPISIAAMPNWGIVTIKGQVAEIFGNKFVVQDGSGRALVETGRAGEGGKLVAKNEAVTVQGRFEEGFIRASFVIHPDGRTEALGGPGGPPHPGLRGWLHHLFTESGVVALPVSPDALRLAG